MINTRLRELHWDRQPSIQGVVIYGFVARGDSDARSDLDIFAVSDFTNHEDLATIKMQLGDLIDCPTASVSVYSSRQIDSMAVYGSLFLWHLKLEGRIIYDKDGWMRNRFDAMSPYDSHAQDLESYRGLFDDVRMRFTELNRLNEFYLFSFFRYSFPRIGQLNLGQILSYQAFGRSMALTILPICTSGIWQGREPLRSRQQPPPLDPFRSRHTRPLRNWREAKAAPIYRNTKSRIDSLYPLDGV